MQTSLNSVLGLVAPLERAWHDRKLIRALMWRDFAARFQGLLLGWLWATTAPPGARLVMHLELIGSHVEMVRDVPILGRLPNPLLYLGTVLVSLVVYRFFQRYKAIFVDVI